MKATEQHFPVVLFMMLYKVVLTVESVDEILKCDHSKLLSGAFPWCLVYTIQDIIWMKPSNKSY